MTFASGKLAPFQKSNRLPVPALLLIAREKLSRRLARAERYGREEGSPFVYAVVVVAVVSCYRSRFCFLVLVLPFISTTKLRHNGQITDAPANPDNGGKRTSPARQSFLLKLAKAKSFAPLDCSLDQITLYHPTSGRTNRSTQKPIGNQTQ